MLGALSKACIQLRNALQIRCCTVLCTYAQALLKQEVLNLDAVEGLLGKRPFTNATLQNIDLYRYASAAAAACMVSNLSMLLPYKCATGSCSACSAESGAVIIVSPVGIVVRQSSCCMRQKEVLCCGSDHHACWGVAVLQARW